LNYKDGEILNGGEKGFCQNWKGKDVCGYAGQPVHYYHYQCEEDEKTTLADCSRYVAESFEHSEDVIVKCSMVDKKDASDIAPMKG